MYERVSKSMSSVNPTKLRFRMQIKRTWWECSWKYAFGGSHRIQMQGPSEAKSMRGRHKMWVWRIPPNSDLGTIPGDPHDVIGRGGFESSQIRQLGNKFVLEVAISIVFSAPFRMALYFVSATKFRLRRINNQHREWNLNFVLER